MVVKFESQSKRNLLPMCWTRAGSGKVEDGDAYAPSQTGYVEDDRKEERGRAETRYWLLAHSSVCFVCCL